ncbi:rhodoquinone biosynthesis methyltransferase RquA [Paludibacterium paludis]|uniref:Methyltransferase n=1 Tax=Paludibacterium paludis TaxID=1225769 RepID=A0A918P2L4_9NEIS|nr:rhodoquinone biosynthesis methyltransferase RquA [Paludibacterium paludis]GGY16311.1 methyltransferase [Paludibacterium paludis]
MTHNPPKASRQLYYEDVPAYMTEVYDWAYVNPDHARLLDRNVVVKTLLFGNDQRLMRAFLARVRPGLRVWQVAHVYGDLVARVAAKTGAAGRFLLTDITPVQVEHAVAKLAAYPHAEVVRADAATYRPAEPFDLIVSFFLLHEVPDDLKCRIVDNMLSQLPEGGEALFVDYHKPAAWQPIGWLLRGVNAWLEPFACALWRKEIREYASEPERFVWEKRTIFGGVYQIVSVRHRARE